MQKDSIHGRRHAVLADAVMDETAFRRLGRKGDRRFRLVVVGAGEVGRARHKFRYRRHDRVDDGFGRFAGGDVLRRFKQRLLVGLEGFRKGCRPLVPQATFELGAPAGGQFGKASLPLLARGGAAAAGFAPAFQHVVGHRERLQ